MHHNHAGYINLYTRRNHVAFFGKYTATLVRLMLLIGLVIMSVIPVRSWAFAQNGLSHLFGSSAPLLQVSLGSITRKGLAFSSEAEHIFYPGWGWKYYPGDDGRGHAGTSNLLKLKMIP